MIRGDDPSIGMARIVEDPSLFSRALNANNLSSLKPASPRGFAKPFVRLQLSLSTAIIRADLDEHGRRIDSSPVETVSRRRQSICRHNLALLTIDADEMSSPDHLDVLVRAFKAAWQFHFHAGRHSGIAESAARPALAQFLVDKTREGVVDEPSLAAAGIEFLVSLDSQPEEAADEALDEPHVCWTVRLEKASARFAPVGRVRWF